MVMMMYQPPMRKLERFTKRFLGVLRTSSRDSMKESVWVSLHLGNGLEVSMRMPTAVHTRTGTLERVMRITKWMKNRMQLVATRINLDVTYSEVPYAISICLVRYRKVVVCFVGLGVG